MLDLVGLGAGLVDGGLQRGRSAAPVAAVGGDHDLGLAVVDAGGQRVGGEATEDDGVGGADPGTRQHRDHGLGDHRHVDRDPVTGLHAEVDQRVGRLAHLVLELGVGDVAGVVLRLADPVEGDLVAAAGLDVPVDAVVRRVELAADEPLGERRVVPVEHLVPLLRPVETLGLLAPEGVESASARVVGVGLHVGGCGELGGRLEPALLVGQVGQSLVLLAHDLSSLGYLVRRHSSGRGTFASLGVDPPDDEGRGPSSPGRTVRWGCGHDTGRSSSVVATPVQWTTASSDPAPVSARTSSSV